MRASLAPARGRASASQAGKRSWQPPPHLCQQGDGRQTAGRDHIPIGQIKKLRPETGPVSPQKSCTGTVQYSGAHTHYTQHTHTHSTLQGTPHGSTQPACLWQPHVQTALLPPTPPRQGRRCKHRAALSYWRENTFHISEETARSSPSKPDPVMLRPRRPPASCLLPTAPLPFPWHVSLWREQAGLLSPRSRTPPQPRALRGSRAAHFHSSCDWTAGLAARSLSFPHEIVIWEAGSQVQAQAPRSVE